MEWSVESLYQELLALEEHSQIEAKRATEIGASVMQTVCAFANEPGLGGGWLLLGVCEPDKVHETYWVEGISDSDKLLGDLQTNCREQFELPIAIESRHAMVEDKLVVGIFVPELDPASKPCGFKGKSNRKTKRKTGVWRRGINGDYECSQKDLEPILLAKAGLAFENILFDDAEWDDIDPAAVGLYRQLRARVRPHAEELLADDVEMLRALNLVKKRGDGYYPTIAGLLLMGKPLSLRRLLPAIRVDYVRIHGTHWVEDPEQRFATTLDFREPLLRLIPRLEATILDDMPRHFQLNEGETQRSDTPLLPQKVVREAVVNALMHRDYRVNQPTLVVRYSNRLEIRNAGYSLKPEAMLGEMGSKLRNPVLAAVLYDLEFAETKGSGIGTMRRLLQQVGLTLPMFSSDRAGNQFTASYLLHQLLGEEQLDWLRQFSNLHLSNEETKALILAKETGAVDNAALRAVSGLDTLSASQTLRRLHHQLGLLESGGAGSATYYRLSGEPKRQAQLTLPLFGEPNTSDLDQNTSDLEPNTSDLEPNTSDIPPDLAAAIAQLTPKARKPKLWPLILHLCALHPHSAEQLAERLNRQVTALKSNHLNPMRQEEELIAYLYPEVVNHPDQAYVITKKGELWLLQHEGKE